MRISDWSSDVCSSDLEERLDLAGSVHLTHDKSFDIRTESATVDLQDGSAAGDSAVTGEGPSGELQAEGFRLRERGQVIVFTGKSRLLIYPDAQDHLAEPDGAQLGRASCRERVRRSV